MVAVEDIPQPASDPYEEGDIVRVYLGEDDLDTEFHGLTCKVVDALPDNLDDLTDRETDRYSYQLRRVDTGEELPIMFRHADLVPEYGQSCN